MDDDEVAEMPRTLKAKLVGALDLTLDDLDEDRLVDILLDAYKAAKRENDKLRGENAHERLMLHEERRAIHEEMRQLRRDPLACAVGDYYFSADGHKIAVRVQGHQIEMFLRRGNIDYAAERIPPEHFIK